MQKSSRNLATLLAAVLSFAIIPAQAGELDTRLIPKLNEAGLAYQIDEDNDYALVISFDDDRSHLVFASSQVFTSRDVGMRDIWADAYVADGEIPAALADRLLHDNVDLVMGTWAAVENRVIYMVRIPEEASADVLRSAILEVAEMADELEKELVGTDEL